MNLPQPPAPGADPQPGAGPSDHELRRLLKQRDQEEAQEARQAVASLSAGDPCPVCSPGGQPGRSRGEKKTPKTPSRMEGQPLSASLAPLITRPGLKCQRCSFDLPAAPNALAQALSLVLALILALGGMTAIFNAQRMSETTPQLITFFSGALLFGGGLFLGSGVQGLASISQLGRRVLRARRLHEEGLLKKKGAGDPGEGLDSIVVAIVLALLIRHFAMEAFVIPTGSMAPTLTGDHFVATCPDCGFSFDHGKIEGELLDGERPQRVTCPLCAESFRERFTPGQVVGGDKILVDKLGAAMWEFDRFQVVVFKFPERPWQNYIKRLIGKPGETLLLRNGDVFAAAPGTEEYVRQVKPDAIQDAIWIPVHDSSFVPADGRPEANLEPGFDEAAFWSLSGPDAGAWTLRDAGAPLGLRCRPPQQGQAPWAEYGRDVRDHYGYARGDSRYADDYQPVADLRLQADVRPEDGAVVRLGILESGSLPGERDERQRLLSGRFPCGPAAGTFALEVSPGPGQPRRTVAEIEGPSLAPGALSEVTLAYADGRARLMVEGELLLEWTDDDPASPSLDLEGGITRGARPMLHVAGAPASFEAQRIDRDIYYLHTGQDYDSSARPIEVPDDSYFCLGDHSPSSQDGRKWGFVNEAHMVGRAFAVFWPLLPNRVQLIR